MKYCFTLIALLLTALSATASESTKLSAFEQFEEQKSVILKDIGDDTIYSEIAYTDAKLVRDALGRMSDSLGSTADLAEMTEQQRADLYNDQNIVNTILTMAENDSRMVCKRRGRLGTNFKTTTCETVKDRRERQQADRLALDQLIRGTPISSN